MKAKYSIIAVLVLLATACETVVKVDIPEHKPSIVINSVIDPAEIFQVHLSRSLGSLDSAPLNNIDNAEVNVYENDVFLQTLKFDGEGVYSSSTINPKLGRNYKVVAKAHPYDEASAVARIPQPVTIENIEIKDSAAISPDGAMVSTISFIIHDPAAIKNFYMVALYETDSALSYLNPIYIMSNDPAFDSEGILNEFIFNDEHFNGRHYKFEGQFYPNYHGSYDPITGMPIETTGKKAYILELSTISREYYLYKTTYAKQVMSEFNPFAEPAPVFTNINKGLGIFAGKVTVTYQH